MIPVGSERTEGQVVYPVLQLQVSAQYPLLCVLVVERRVKFNDQ